MQTNKLYENTWEFNEGGVRFFLLAGAEKAALIDSGMSTKNAKQLAEEITGLPLILINTHADVDHIGSNAQFDSFYMNPAECSNYYRSGRSGAFLPARDGDVIDLGGRPLKVIETPGHTPGSIALLDVLNRRIFTGDPIQDGRIFMFGVQREMHAYISSLERLEKMTSEFDLIYPSHGSCPVLPDMISKLKADAVKILRKEVSGTPGEVFGQKIVSYDMGDAVFLCDQ